MSNKKQIPHKKMKAENFIDWVNFNFNDDPKRCRVLLAEILLRVEELQNK